MLQLMQIPQDTINTKTKHNNKYIDMAMQFIPN